MAWLDGIIGALVVEAFTARAFLRPVAVALHHGSLSSAAYLAFPIVDLFLLTLIAAAAAHTRWRVRGWKAIGAGPRRAPIR